MDSIVMNVLSHHSCDFKNSRLYYGLKTQYKNESLESERSGDGPLLPTSHIFNYQNGYEKLCMMVF